MIENLRKRNHDHRDRHRRKDYKNRKMTEKMNIHSNRHNQEERRGREAQRVKRWAESTTHGNEDNSMQTYLSENYGSITEASACIWVCLYFESNTSYPVVRWTVINTIFYLGIIEICIRCNQPDIWREWFERGDWREGSWVYVCPTWDTRVLYDTKNVPYETGKSYIKTKILFIQQQG